MNKTTLKIILALLILLALWQSGSYLNGQNRFQQLVKFTPKSVNIKQVAAVFCKTAATCCLSN
jgi:hypothetical protein